MMSREIGRSFEKRFGRNREELCGVFGAVGIEHRGITGIGGAAQRFELAA